MGKREGKADGNCNRLLYSGISFACDDCTAYVWYMDSHSHCSCNHICFRQQESCDCRNRRNYNGVNDGIHDFYCFIIPTVNAFATGNIPGIVITLAMAAVLILIIYLVNHKIVRDKNNKIREANYEIMVNNDKVVNQLKVLYSRAMELDKALRSQLTPGGFYPQAYTYEQAAESFVRYINNMEYGTPVTMQILIEKYDNDVYRQQEMQHSWHSRINA